MISGRKNSAARYQGPSDRKIHNESQSFEDAVMRQYGVQCSVTIKEKEIRVKTRDYTDYIFAKSVIKQRTGLEVVRAQ